MDIPKWLGAARTAWAAVGGLLAAGLFGLQLPEWITKLFGEAGTDVVFGAIGAVVLLFQFIRSALAEEKNEGPQALVIDGVKLKWWQVILYILVPIIPKVKWN